MHTTTNNNGNATISAIITRLPKHEMIGPTDIALAFGLATTKAILQDIQCGKLAAAQVGRRYIISRAEAERYIRATAYAADQA